MGSSRFSTGVFLTAAIVVAAFYTVGFFYWRGRDAEGRLEGEKFALPILLGIANLITLGLFSLEIIDYFDSRPYADFYLRSQDNLKFLSLTVLWAVYGSAVASVGLVRDYPMARWAGLGLLSVAALKLLGFDAFNVGSGPAVFHTRSEHPVPGLCDSPSAGIRPGVLVRASARPPCPGRGLRFPESGHSRKHGRALDIEPGSDSLLRQPRSQETMIPTSIPLTSR